MGLFTLLRFLTPNATVAVSESGTDLSTTAALGQAVENLDTYALRLNGTNALTSAGTLDASLASDTAGLKLPSKAGAAPTGAANIAFDSTAGGLAFGDGVNTVGLTGMKRLGDTTLGIAATNITFSSIPGTYKHLVIELQSRGDTSATSEGVFLQLNGDGTATYDWTYFSVLNGATSIGSTFTTTGLFIGLQSAATAAGNLFGGTTIRIPNYAGTTAQKSVTAEASIVGHQASETQVGTLGGNWRSTAAVTSIKLFPQTSTNFVAGTRATLYGVN